MQCLKLWALRFIGPDLGAAVVVQDGFAKFGIVFALALQSWYRTALLLGVGMIYYEAQNLFCDIGSRKYFSFLCLVITSVAHGICFACAVSCLLAASIGGQL